MTLKVVNGEGQPPGRPWARPLLIASLALNLLLVGAFIGGLWAARHHGPRGPQRIEQGFLAYVKSLPRERAQTLLSTADNERQTLRAQRKALRDKRTAALALVEAETFDKEALRAALGGVSEAEGKLEHTAESVFIDMVARLTPAERKGYVAWRMRHDAHEGREHRAGPDGGADKK